MFFSNRNLLHAHARPFGLDISDLSLKLVWLEGKNEALRVGSFASVALKPGVVTDGEIIQEEDFIAALKDLITIAGPKRLPTRQAVCSLPEMKVFLRVLFLPRMEDEELAGAIKWELEGAIPLPAEEIYYDYQVLSTDDGFLVPASQEAVLVVASARRTVDRTLVLVERAGVEVVGLETESTAQARTLAPTNAFIPETTLIVDLSARRTSFFIAVGPVPVFASTSHISAQMLTDAIAKSRRISFQAAEDLKCAQGLGTSLQESPFREAVTPILEGIVAEIERSMRFYLGSLRYTADIHRILLCGGGANLIGLVPYLTLQFQKPVLLADSWMNFHFDTSLPPIPATDALQYATAIGLALKNTRTSIYV